MRFDSLNRYAPIGAVTLSLALVAGSAFGFEVPPEVVKLRDQAAAYEHGEGVPKDPFRAFELYCAAARAGDADAQYALGWMYANGRGVLRNDALASAFFHLASEQGLTQATAMLDRVGPAGDLPECMRDPLELVEYSEAPIPGLAPPEPLIALGEDETPFIANNANEARVAALVQTIAPAYRISPQLALAFIRAESNFDSKARSPKNAQGLMQLIPETSARFNVKQPYDPEQNIRGGLAYLRWLLAYFRGNVPLVAAAYNAGERAVERYRGVPPYAETRAYVKRIVALFRKHQHPFDPAVTEPSPLVQQIRLSGTQ